MTFRPYSAARTRGRALAFAALGLLIGLATTGQARAGLIISTPSFADFQGSTGRFEIDVTYQSSSASDQPIDLVAFSTQISVLADSGVTFIDATTDTTPASRFVFDGLPHDPLSATDGNDPDPVPAQLGSPFSHPVTSLKLSDGTFDPSDNSTPPRTINPGDTFVLAVISYRIAAGAPAGPVELTVAPFPGSDLTDPGGNDVISGVQSGTLTVLTRAVPEPSTLVSLASGGLPLALMLTFRRRRARRAA